MNEEKKSDFREIVWLASYPKSGNTWVRLFLDAYFLGEIDLNEMVLSVADDNSIRCALGGTLDEVWNVKKLPVDLQGLTRPMALLRLVLAYKENKIEGIPLFVKTHNPHMVVNGIEQIPECLTKAVICIVRDPRDVVPSYAKHMGETIDEAIASMQNKYRVLESAESLKVADLISSWDRNVSSYLGADTHNVMVVKYEDMRANPVETFRGILQHAGIAPNNERIKQALEICEISKLQQLEKETGFPEASPKNKDGFFSGGGQAGGWKEKLTELQVRKIERAFESPMRKLGYLEGKTRKVYPH